MGIDAMISPPGETLRSLRLAAAESLTDEASSVLAGRCAGVTLDALGRQRGVSRERIRQVEDSACKKLRKLLRFSAAENLERFMALLDRPGASEGELAAPFKPGNVTEPEIAFLRYTLWAFKARPAAAFGQVVRDWWTADQSWFAAELRDVAGVAPCDEPELIAALSAHDLGGMDPTIAFAGKGSPIFHDARVAGWIRRTPRDRDAAWMALRRAAIPMTPSELSSQLALKTHNLDEAMRRDARFTRLRPSGRWSLTDWGLSESRYESTLEAVVDVLREQGPQTLAQLTRGVIARYPVSPGAVHQCLSHESVGRWPDGRVDLVDRGAPRREESRPARPAGIIHQEGGDSLVMYRRVDGELLRGSGLQLHRYVTWALDMNTAPRSRLFAIGDGPLIEIKKGVHGSTISSLRAFAIELGAREGCQLVLRLNTGTDTATIGLACEDHTHTGPVMLG